MTTTAQDTPQRPLQPPEWTPPLPSYPPSAPPTPPDPRRLPTLPTIHVPATDCVTMELLRRRIIVATGLLDATAAADISERLLLLDADRRAPITVHFSCTEIALDAASSLAASLELVHSEVTMIAVGAVERAAVGVYACAGVRRAHPYASFLLLDAEALPTAGDVALAAAVHQRQLDVLHARIATAAGRDPAALAADMHDGRLLTAHEALDYGLVQSLTTS